MAQSFDHFDPALLKFLSQLKRNNNRDWFNKNKGRYEAEVLYPALEFVEAFAPRLKKISPCFDAVPKRVGGSVMRIYRDTRFSKDKTPYKTNVGIHFRHQTGRDVHGPGFYLHLAPGECFLGTGIWHPDGPTLAKIRAGIDENRSRWKRVRNNKRFRETFEWSGDSLKRPPRGFAADDPLIDDLKRKDFIGVAELDPAAISHSGFIDRVGRDLAAGRSLMQFLCDALRVPF